MAISSVLRPVEFLGGLLLVLTVLSDVFQSVVVPRAVGRRYRVSVGIVGASWSLWRRCAMLINDTERREDFLGTYAPLFLIVILVAWVVGMVVGYGLQFHALADQLRPRTSIEDALYFSGTSLLTIGFGDVVPHTGATRFLALAAGASGLGTVAVTTTFLFSLFGAFRQREVFVVTFGVRAGAPPSGVTLLETYARLGMLDHLADVFEDGVRWAADVLESHLAYPMLAYFRSSHDYESWVGTLGALLDASTLALTTIRGNFSGPARLMNETGRHLTHDLSRYFGLEPRGTVGVERSEFDAARKRLRDAGCDVFESDDAWDAFARVRRSYAASLDAMTRFWRIPPAQWVGDRSLLPEHRGGTEGLAEIREVLDRLRP